MFDWIDFEIHDGSRQERDVKVLALSTCGFCKRGMEFLDSHNIKYQYLYVDLLPKEQRKRLSEEFKEKFKQRGLYPTLIVDDEEFQLGFIEKAWAKSLGIS